jgi:glyceraldehyde-3-phosphate dehydrogenase/erythrose-4-phosphate dehydrogenase
LRFRHYRSSAPKHIEIVAANDLTPGDEMAYPSGTIPFMGSLRSRISAEGNAVFGDTTIKQFAEKDPTKLPRKEHGVD